MRRTTILALFASLLAATMLVGTGPVAAEDVARPNGQDLWRSCSSCHCVPDPRIPEDDDWLKLNETTTCISGANDTPEARRALIAYLRAEGTIRPLLIDERGAGPSGKVRGRLRVPATAGSAYLKAERRSVRAGSPPKIRIRWSASETGRALAVPVGDYRVIAYAFYRTDEQRRLWVAAGSSAEGCTELAIRKDAEAAFDLRPEITGHLSCKKSETGFLLGFYMTNRNDKRMSLSRDGKLVDPNWIVTGAEGERIDAGDFEVT